jgi:iron complex outermembrane receptor protein
VGSKFEHNIYTGWETQPSARLLWTPGPHQTVWAGVSRAIRSPSRIDENLQLTGFVGFIPLAPPPVPSFPLFLEVAGNPKFVSEKLLAYEAGYRRLFTSRFYVDVSAFYNVYTDLTNYGSIVLTSAAVPAPPHLLYVVTYGNGLRGATDGIEIAPDWKITDRWQLKGSYSYLHMGIKPSVPGGDSGTAMMDNGSSPHHEVVVQSLFNLPARFEFDPTYRYVSKLPLQSVNSYSTMDLRLSRKLGKQIELSVMAKNLFQPHHSEFSGDPGPLVGIERTAYAKITWTRESR